MNPSQVTEQPAVKTTVGYQFYSPNVVAHPRLPYIILVDEVIEDLQRKVALMLAEGYVCCGGLAAGRHDFPIRLYQAMILAESK